VALLAATGVHDHEFWVPYYRLREEGAQVLVCGFRKGDVYAGEGVNGKDGPPLAPADAAIAQVRAGSLDALVIPGGIYGPLAFRAHEPALRLVRAMDRAGKVIASICHGPWVLASAGILRGRKVTSPRDIAVDMTNAGARWINQKVVCDRNLITAVYFGFLPEFLQAVIAAIERQRRARQGGDA